MSPPGVAAPPPAEPEGPSAFDFDPLPVTPPPRRGGALDHLKAFLVIRWLRLADAARRAGALARRRPAAVALAAGAALLLAAAGVAGIAALRQGPKTVAEAREAALARPRDGAAQRGLGHALFREGRRHDAIASYGKALALDPSVADREMAANLVASFGGKDQRAAEELIWRNRIVGAQGALESLVGAGSYGVRWGAVRTLDRLERGTLANWESAYMADLEAADCRIRRNAVEKLAEIGTDRSVAALRAASAREKAPGVPSRRRCLGDRPAEAERKILAGR
jgi:tetratricopeptide (TPR) repeat protein